MNLNADVRERLDAHLDAVEKALVEAKCSRERRRGIVDDLEAQILDMLAGRSAKPTLADLDAVLALLDPPAAYGEASETASSARGDAGSRVAEPVGAGGSGPQAIGGPPAGSAALDAGVAVRPRISKMAVAGFICILLGMVLSAVAVGSLAAFYAYSSTGPRNAGRGTGPEAVPGTVVVTRYERSTGSSTMVVTMVVVSVAAPALLGLIGTALGWTAFGRIRSSKGRLYGSGLALFDGLFYPILCGLFLFVLLPLPMIAIAVVAAVVVAIVLITRRAPARV